MAAIYETVLDAGADAPWIVMVHGMSQDRRVFSAQVEAFKDRYRILLVDLPGHGLSADIPGPFGHKELAAEVCGAIDRAGISACIYWGTHTGTALGLLLASRRPDRFYCLILEGVVLPGHAMPSIDAELQRVRDVARRRGVAEARRRWFDEADWFAVIRRYPEACRAAAHRAIVAGFPGAPWIFDGAAEPVGPIDDALAALDLPVLIYNGAHDLADFVAAADRLAALLARGRRETIADAGGFPAWEFPDRVNRLVERFLTSVRIAGA